MYVTIDSVTKGNIENKEVTLHQSTIFRHLSQHHDMTKNETSWQWVIMNWYHDKWKYQDKPCFVVDYAPVQFQFLNYYDNTTCPTYLTVVIPKWIWQRGGYSKDPMPFSLQNLSDRQLRIKVAWWLESRTGGLRIICNKFLINSLSLLSLVTGSIDLFTVPDAILD